MFLKIYLKIKLRYFLSVATNFCYLHNYEELRYYAEKSEKISINAFGVYNENHASTLVKIARLFFDLGCFSEAESLLVQSKGIFNPDIDKKGNYTANLSNLAYVYLELGRFSDAEKLFLEAKKRYYELREKNSFYFKGEKIFYTLNDLAYAISLNNLGYLYADLGRYNDAETLLIESTEIYKLYKNNKKFAEGYANNLNGLADLYRKIGRYDDAETLFNESIEIHRHYKNKMISGYSSTLMHLANFYRDFGHYSEAEPLYTEGIGLVTRLNDHPQYAKWLIDLADLYKKMRRYNEALSLYKEATEILKKN